MTEKEPKKGLYDSSLTRIQPVFQTLIRRDPSGISWLPNLLELAASRSPFAVRLATNPGSLLPKCLEKRTVGRSVQKYYGMEDDPELEACFEKTLPPSEKFLRWLIQHPEKMTWPRQGKQTYSALPQAKREDLMGKHSPEKQAAVQAEALAELKRTGASRSHGKWWAFEGISKVDCCLETENMLLLIEGKRTETLSSKTDWYTERNQLVRNLEVAQEIAGYKNFAVLMIAGNKIDELNLDIVRRSLPHLSIPEQESLMQHYLGCITWREVCNATNISYASLPDTVADWVNNKRSLNS